MLNIEVLCAVNLNFEKKLFGLALIDTYRLKVLLMILYYEFESDAKYLYSKNDFKKN